VLQYAQNALFRLFADRLGRTPDRFIGITDLPFLPISFFKQELVKTGDFTPERIFESSGTTGITTSRHAVRDLSVYNDQLLHNFVRLYGAVENWCILALLPSYLERNNSSLVYMVDYLIKASADLAVEQGPCLAWKNLKYADGLLPIDTRKQEVDELVPHQERMPWSALREQILSTGIRNATLMALMPAETSAQISNATNGIEPPRSYVSIKQSKHGVLRQVVPEYRKLKNKYELLWDQRSPEGYLKICAVLQKYIDQGISTNTSYNPKYYEDEKIPMSEMLKHLIMCYKYGTKQLYYFNTNDGQGEIDVDKIGEKQNLPLAETIENQEDCDSCII
jgi:hypothetical protein